MESSVKCLRESVAKYANWRDKLAKLARWTTESDVRGQQLPPIDIRMADQNRMIEQYDWMNQDDPMEPNKNESGMDTKNRNQFYLRILQICKIGCCFFLKMAKSCKVNHTKRWSPTWYRAGQRQLLD